MILLYCDLLSIKNSLFLNLILVYCLLEAKNVRQSNIKARIFWWLKQQACKKEVLSRDTLLALNDLFKFLISAEHEAALAWWINLHTP